MTIDRLESIVLRLANQAPTRYWRHWNYPQTNPWHMAIRVAETPSPQLAVELERMGFWQGVFGSPEMFIVERDQEDIPTELQ